MGAATLADEVGLDVASHIMEYLTSVFGERMAGANPAALKDMVSAGFHGRKSGKGIFVYQEGVKEREINQDVENLIKKYSIERKVQE